MPSSRQQAEPPSSVPPHQRPHRLAGPAPDACTAGRPLLSSARSCPAWPGPPPCSVKILGPLSPASLLQACGYVPCHLARCPCTPGLRGGCSCPGHSGPPPWLPVHSRAPSLDSVHCGGRREPQGSGLGHLMGSPPPGAIVLAPIPDSPANPGRGQPSHLGFATWLKVLSSSPIVLCPGRPLARRLGPSGESCPTPTEPCLPALALTARLPGTPLPARGRADQTTVGKRRGAVSQAPAARWLAGR